MAKRAFQRIGDTARDTYQDATGLTRVRDLVMDPDPGDGTSSGTEAAEQNSTSVPVEQLLRALESGDAHAPEALLPFIHDMRVRSALLNAAGELSIPLLGNVAYALVQGKVAAAAGPLRDRLSELVRDPRTIEDAPFFNARAGTLSAVAAAVLKLQPQTREAVEALIRLLSHPNAFNRRTAAAALSETILEVRLPDDMSDLARSTLAPLLTTKDAGMFAAIAPSMASGEPDVVLARCQDLLKSVDASDRELSVAVLTKLTEPKAQDMLAVHVLHEKDLRLACQIAIRVRQAIPEEFRAEVARRALSDGSPSTRYDGLLLLSALDADISRSLAVEALTDEPDPIIRAKLEGFVAPQSDGSEDSPRRR